MYRIIVKDDKNRIKPINFTKMWICANTKHKLYKCVTKILKSKKKKQVFNKDIGKVLGYPITSTRKQWNSEFQIFQNDNSVNFC